MISDLFAKVERRLSKHNNGLFKNILYKLDREDLSPVIPKIDINWTWIHKGNYLDVLAFREENVAVTFENMIEDNRKGVFAIHQDRCVAHCWVCIGRTTDPSTIVNDLISLQEDEAYIYSCHTDPDYRGNNIYPFLLYTLSKYLFDVEKVSTILIATSIDNIPSRRGIKKVGFHEQSLVKTLRFLDRTLIRNFSDL